MWKRISVSTATFWGWYNFDPIQRFAGYLLKKIPAYQCHTKNPNVVVVTNLWPESQNIRQNVQNLPMFSIHFY